MSELQIEKTLGVTTESVLNKEHNLWIGFSFGNKWFTKENLEQLIRLGLKYTKKSLLVWIPGRMLETNLKYIDELGRAESLKISFEMGDKKNTEIQNFLSSLPREDKDKLIIANYEDIFTEQYVRQREAILREFSKKELFYGLVIEISKEILDLRKRTISIKRIESASLYILQELPLFIDGAAKIGDNTTHTVLLYPGLGKLDELVMKIKNDEIFKTFRDKLNIKNNTGVVSVK